MEKSDGIKETCDGEKGRPYWCGVACCKPKFLRKLADVKVYAACLALLMLLNTAATVGYTSGSLTSIEKHFDLKTRDMGIIVAFSEIGNLSLLLFVGFFGQRGHKPRIIGVGAFVFGLGVLISAFPHFVNDPKPLPASLDMDLVFKLQTCPEGNPQFHFLQVLMESAPDDGRKPLTELFGPQFGITPNNSDNLFESFPLLTSFVDNGSPAAVIPSKMSFVGSEKYKEKDEKITPFPAVSLLQNKTAKNPGRETNFLLTDSLQNPERSPRVAREAAESMEVRKFREYIKNPGIRNLIGQNFGVPTDEKSLMQNFRLQLPEKQAEAISNLQFIFGDVEISESTEPLTQETPSMAKDTTPDKFITPSPHIIKPTMLSAEQLKTTIIILKQNVIVRSFNDTLTQYLQISEFRDKILKLLKINDEEATLDEIVQKYAGFSPKKQEKITKKIEAMISSLAEKETTVTKKQDTRTEIDPLTTTSLKPPSRVSTVTRQTVDKTSSFRHYLRYPPVRAKLITLLGAEADATPEELMDSFSNLPPERQSMIVAQLPAAFLPQTTPDNRESSPPSMKQYLIGQLMNKPELMAELKDIVSNSPNGQLDSEIFLAFIVRVLASSAESPQIPRNISRAELLSKFGVELPIKCPEGDEENQDSNFKKVVWLAIGQLIVGMGQTPFFPLGITYMDEALDDQTTPIFIGFVMMAFQLGPILGFFLNFFILQLYVDFNYYDSSDIEMSIFDPRWVGAWWLGYIVLGCTMICYSFVFWFFPRKLQKHSSLKKKDTPEASAMHSKMPSLKDLPKAAFRVMKDPILPAVFMAIVFEISVVIALSYFAPKFLEQQYGLSKPKAAMLFGFLIIPASCLGTFLGGCIVKRFKFTRTSCIRFVLCMSFIVISCYIALLASGCNRPKIAGVFVNHDGTPYGNVNGSSVCSADCQCPDQYMPVCGSNKVTYYNPCQAGCTELSEEITAGPMGYPLRTFTNCSCVEGSQGPEPEGTAALLPCKVDCNTLPIFLAVAFMAVIFGSTSQNSLIMTILWTAKEEDRSFCLSIVSFLCRLLGFIPAPIFIGALIDSTCEVWEEGCSGEQGSCLIYNTVNYRFAYLGMALAFKIGAFILYIITLINLKRENKKDEETNRSKSAPYHYDLAPQIDGDSEAYGSSPSQKFPTAPNEKDESLRSISSNSESFDYIITTI